MGNTPCLPASSPGFSSFGFSSFGVSAFGTITMFGLVVAGTMELIRRWHRDNTIRHRDEVERLLAIARSDPH